MAAGPAPDRPGSRLPNGRLEGFRSGDPATGNAWPYDFPRTTVFTSIAGYTGHVTTLIPEQELRVSLTSDDTHCLVRFEGVLFAGSVHLLQELVDELGSLRCERVSVDLTELTQWDTAGGTRSAASEFSGWSGDPGRDL